MGKALTPSVKDLQKMGKKVGKSIASGTEKFDKMTLKMEKMAAKSAGKMTSWLTTGDVPMKETSLSERHATSGVSQHKPKIPSMGKMWKSTAKLAKSVVDGPPLPKKDTELLFYVEADSQRD